jgi:predicted ATPase/class 3 adenylate cyclase
VAEFPAGTVTFLFTDIEGSTRLLRELGDAYADALAEHRTMLRDAFERHGGVEVDRQGDAFFVAFARAKDALAAARDAQAASRDDRLRVRMGIHTGEPLLTGDGYVGLDVHRAARIAAVGHGGQVLVSQSTRDLCGDDGLRDLGSHRLKDLTAPERIYQLGRDEFPPLKSLNRTNLPFTAAPLVGRQRELDELLGLLRDGTRLLTLTGAGGSGKTRLALQVAAELVDDFPDSVHFVPLAPIRDPGLVAATIAERAGVRELEDLHHAHTLLLLDNFEHLISAATEVSELLVASSTLKVLATSRVRLNLAGEQEFPLDPLLPDEAVEFFVDRARTVKRDLRFDEAVPEICRRLDGLPLALELAASRVKVLDPPLLLERLDRRLPLLTGGARDAPKRQQTLRGTIEWSYDLLNAQLQRIFCRLSVFRGTFSLDASERITGASFDDVAALVDWNLLKPIGRGRFLMLETIREYGSEVLEASGESDALRSRHLEFFLALVEEAEPQLTGPEQRSWYETLRLEHDNIREALAFACDSGDAERALMLAGTIWRFWWNRGYTEEAGHWYERAFAADGDASARARARALYGFAHVSESRGEPEKSLLRLQEAADLFRQIDDNRWLVLALTHRASAHASLGERDEAERCNNEALVIATATGDVRGASIVKLNIAAHELEWDGDSRRAGSLIGEALAGFRDVGDTYGIAGALGNLGSLELRQSEIDAAAGHVHESLVLSHSLGDAHTLVHTLVDVAAIALARGDAVTAARLCAADEVLCETHGFQLEPFQRKLLMETAAAAAALGAQADDEWLKGSELDLDAVTALAREALGDADS